MPKWSKYLDDDFEDEFQRIEKIKPKTKQLEEKRTPKKPSSIKHNSTIPEHK